MMTLWIVIALAVLSGVTGSPNVTVSPDADMLAHPNSVPEYAMEETEIPGQQQLLDVAAEEYAMATGELNTNHYPAQRAAKVVQHYLNTRHGSPFRLFGLHRVHSAHAEDVADSGRKYQLEISALEIISNTTEKCSAQVLFPRGEQQGVAQVQCDEILQINITTQEEALYQQYKNNHGLLSAQHLPDSHGHIDPDMRPFWHLGIVASSFVMLNESNENTLYNMAQVANITQLVTENEQLKFDSDILLHEMVSQEIIHWKLQFTWSPPEGVKVQHMEQLPHRHEWEKLNNTN
ncbi:latexin [Labrus mixtus]|uniref:latexin n=1 Tax=Labrus mixtus TaxID=508554 RepID=UPI0029C07AA8|nr:latexin [Labrus mixtus]